MYWSWALILVGALMVLLEVALGGFAGFDLVLIGSSCVVGGFTGLLSANTTAGFTVAGVLGILYMVAGRRWVRDRLRHRSVSSNTDALIGQRALVVAAIAPHLPGQVRVRDEVWRARPAEGQPDTVEAGSEVVVERVDGVTLIVRR
jgi:membrane protein implicated in regulation of membrane protease activity